MRVLLPILAALLFALSGCKGQCRQLSEKLCECSALDPTVPASTLEREQCLRRVSNEDQRWQPTPEQELVCAELLPACDCQQIGTAEGKRACGLAR